MIEKLFAVKPLKQLMEEVSDSSQGMKRSLTAFSLITLGIGAIIGADA